MPRSKKAAYRGRGRGPRNNDGRQMPGLATSFVSFAGSGTRQENDGYSLRSEALHTQRHQSSWDSDQRLRHTKVMFVSARDSERSKIADPATDLAQMTLSETSKDLRGNIDSVELDMPLDPERSVTDQDERPSEISDEISKPFIIDIQGDEGIITGLPPPQIRSTSPTPSDSSDEVIVFAGRDRTGRGLSKFPKINNNIIIDSYDSQIRMIEDKIHENKKLLAVNTAHAERSSTTQRPIVDSIRWPQRDSSEEAFTQTQQQSTQLMPEMDVIKSGSSRRARNRHCRKTKRDHEQAVINDYVSNIEAQELNSELSFNQRDLGSIDSDPWQATETSSLVPSKMIPLSVWDRLELDDFNIMSTSDEVFGSVQAILSKRNRGNGQQYLVVWEHQSMDEARWVPTSSLNDVNSMKLIAQFEAKEKAILDIFGGREDDIDSDTDKSPVSDEDIEDPDHDSYILQRKIDRMTDEKIATLLAKQEELGMGSSELMLFDDSREADFDQEDKINRFAPKPARRSLRNVLDIKRTKGDFPTASAWADVYDGFNVMDFERPSLNKKPKGRKGQLAFDLSDSELEASMAATWDKDRSKKRERKDERQALRAQGLLGKKDARPDLKAKYKEGMGILAVKDEIKNFFMGDNTTLALPPMDKTNRKIVHDLANALNLTSKSAGTGNKRFPVLYRTSRTSSFSETKFAAVEARLTRRYLPRLDLRGKNSISIPNRSGRGGVSNAAVSYRDGDIVGGSAPELGIENKGRAMLEKMGWSTGTALGALNNKGILQPVSHVVKTTKAGLG